MQFKISKYILGLFDFIILYNAFDIGIKMINQIGGYQDFPLEWLGKTPFVDYVMPGYVGITIYGLGNLIALAFAIFSRDKKSYMTSLIMGLILCSSMVFQRILLGETYMATGILMLVGLIQISLSMITMKLYQYKLRSSYEK
ncbi:hypothetical protein EZV73_24210 [Acidaminobacter sp. JC074]|uniref:hypothetical protein n=1 Tax=Acidaminobacter sp. JC074 TaxID=2530199 RepID=UPI001F1087DD|nr:hypothetical protein [Acidaminobacter sp. JC074]MCH4890706.1 hypothetical protein [Acidaminobacter sp. JC074]